MNVRYLICLLLICPRIQAQEPVETAEVLPEGASEVTLHMLTRREKYEYFYSIDKAEVDRLVDGDTHKYIRIVGYGSSKPGPGLVQLKRAVRDGWHVFYTEFPKGEKFPAGTTFEPFPIWVWEKPAPGLVPVYGVSFIDWRTMRFYTTKEAVKADIDATVKAFGRKPRYHGIMFYILPPKDPTEDPKDNDAKPE